MSGKAVFTNTNGEEAGSQVTTLKISPMMWKGHDCLSVHIVSTVYILSFSASHDKIIYVFQLLEEY